MSTLTDVDGEGEITAASVPDGDDEPNELSCALESKARYWPEVRSGWPGVLATDTASSRPSGFATLNPLPGGVIPSADYDFLKKAGVAAIYGPGTNIPHAAAEILSLIQKQRLAA